jgi:hypothetical protein
VLAVVARIAFALRPGRSETPGAVAAEGGAAH